MATIRINGNVFEVPDGSSVSVNGGTITVGGRQLVTGLGHTTHIEWTGPVGKLDCQSCTIKGDVHGNVDAQSVQCGNITGNVDAQAVNCGNIGGSVDATVVNRR